MEFSQHSSLSPVKNIYKSNKQQNSINMLLNNKIHFILAGLQMWIFYPESSYTDRQWRGMWDIEGLNVIGLLSSTVNASATHNKMCDRAADVMAFTFCCPDLRKYVCLVHTLTNHHEFKDSISENENYDAKTIIPTNCVSYSMMFLPNLATLV